MTLVYLRPILARDHGTPGAQWRVAVASRGGGEYARSRAGATVSQCRWPRGESLSPLSAAPGYAVPNVAGHRAPHFALFHDGNAGHFWRGEVASSLGDVIIYTGALIWLAYLGASPTQIGLALALIGIPYIFFGPLATTARELA